MPTNKPKKDGDWSPSKDLEKFFPEGAVPTKVLNN